jgi:glyoxylase-like metal-dependent hydrolase (beta-lactamase superfamily II)
MFIVHQIINHPVPSNCFVLFDKAVGCECVVVDPGSKSDDELFVFFEEEGLVPKYIVLTHEHFDHCWGVNDLVEKYHIPIVCSALCAECIKYEKRNCSVFYDNNESFVITGEAITVESLNYLLPFAGTALRFIPTPGHTNASVCFTVGQNLFTGDTLIKDLRTVTKLPTGSAAKLKDTLDVLAELKGNGLTVCAGHGESFPLDDYKLEIAL